jgi:hypothetical protein
MCRREIVRAWNNAVAICFGHRWRQTGSGSLMMGVWRSRWAVGTRQLGFEPLDLLEKLA